MLDLDQGEGYDFSLITNLNKDSNSLNKDVLKLIKKSLRIKPYRDIYFFQICHDVCTILEGSNDHFYMKSERNTNKLF